MTTPRLLSNRYELGDTLGYGGMSEVHKGRDVRLGRDVAVKVLRADLARDPQFQERFRREAQNAAALNHPAIVAVYDTGETRTEHGPLPYIVMEYVDGRTLRDIVKTEGPLPGQRAMEIMADVSAALDFSHRHGIVHRDVKPANVMITKTGAVKVMDFGIARAVHDGQAAVTQTAAVIGTAQYLSPEQARGEQVDARSDVYAAGCVLFELLTGEPPFTGDSPVAVAYQHVREDPRAPSAVNPRVNPALDAIVLKAMSKGAPNRYQSAAEMRTDLVRVLSGQRPLAPMVMTDEDRTTILAAGRNQEQPRGRHRPAALADDYDDYDPYEDDEEERKRRRRKGWTIALVSVLALALLGIIAWLASDMFGGDDTNAGESAVPDVVGQRAEDARQSLEAAGWKPAVVDVVCEPTATNQPGPCGPEKVGTVISTDPAAGTMASKSETITLNVGVAPAQVPVPDVSGQDAAEARKNLTDAGFVVVTPDVTEEVEDEAEVGKVIAQDPAPGTQVAKGTEVRLTVGEAQETISVPNLTGQQADTAEENLRGLGFEVRREEVASGEPAGTVVDQNPKSGKHPAGTEIVLSVSNGEQAGFQMPDLRGMTPNQAENQLRQLGWTGDFNEVPESTNDPTEDGRILDQEQDPGSNVAKDSAVGISVGEYELGAVVSERARMRTAVVGAGVIGLSTTYALLRHGSEAICFDTGRPMAARSTGSSRIFRLAHGVPGLVSYAAAAREWWADWSHRAGTRLLGSQGLVVTGDLAKDWAAAMVVADAEHTLVDDTDSLDLPIRSVPGPALVDPAGGVIEAVATGRFLRAAVGNRVRSAHVHRLEVRDDEVVVHASDGRHSVDRVVVAAGRGTMELAAQVGVYLPTELAHHARFTFRLKDQDASPPCWIDRTEDWRPGVTTYQQLSGRGRWSIGMSFGLDEVAWQRGRTTVVRESRELVTEYVREALPGLEEEIVEEIYCDYPPGLGDGVHTATTGPVTVVWGDNLFKHAPAVGESLATAAVNEVTPHIPG